MHVADRDNRLTWQHRRRILILLAMTGVVAVVAAIEPFHRVARSAIAITEPVIRQHAVIGAVVFVLVSALSAMVVFFSTALITPVAVDAFGPLVALLLLWFGWILGGLAAYAIGRFLGRRAVSWFLDPRKLHEYERRAARLVSFRRVLLFQLAVPSEIPGYVLGLSGCRLRTFIAANALGELPFAIGAVYLGESFLQRNYLLLLAIGIAGVALSWAVFRRATAMWSSDGMPGDARATGVLHDEQRDRSADGKAEVLAHPEEHPGGEADQRP